ncbi:terpenoid synthase [Xylaria cubensis]|nr:terpenoid synthase [Xylaria cubensis]
MYLVPDRIMSTERENLINRIRGSHLMIPDLQALVSHWPHDIHPQINQLENHVQKVLESIFPERADESRLCKMKSSSIPLFAASWWPYASFEVLCVATTLSIWLFAWDDETDSLEFSSLNGDMESASVFRNQTVEYIREIMNQDKHGRSSTITQNRIIRSFKPIGDAICSSSNKLQSQTFLEELIFFIKMCEEEQKVQMNGRFPSVEEYLQRRMGSSAVGVCLAITEYATGATLPEEIMRDDSMKILWHETNMIISTVNDILSVKKEIGQSQPDTLIPLLFAKFNSMQAAIDEAVLIVSNSIDRFQRAESDVLSRYATCPNIERVIQDHINAYKSACTANINWSLVSGRYQLYCKSMKNGIEVEL